MPSTLNDYVKSGAPPGETYELSQGKLAVLEVWVEWGCCRAAAICPSVCLSVEPQRTGASREMAVVVGMLCSHAAVVLTVMVVVMVLTVVVVVGGGLLRCHGAEQASSLPTSGLGRMCLPVGRGEYTLVCAMRAGAETANAPHLGLVDKAQSSPCACAL